MSVNDVIFISNKNYEVLYQGCMDNGLEGVERIGKGKNLADAYKIARKWVDKRNDNDDIGTFCLEYGIQII